MLVWGEMREGSDIHVTGSELGSSRETVWARGLLGENVKVTGG